MRILFLTPPMTQLNTPYPATAYLTGFLAQHAPEHVVAQADPALELFLRLFSKDGLGAIAGELRARLDDADDAPPPSIAHFLANADAYVTTIDAVVGFLQGRDPALAMRIATRVFLPEGPRFTAIGQGPGLDWAFGKLGVADRGKHLASLYIDDLADVIKDGIQPHFELARYGEHLAASAPSFDALHDELEGEPTLVDATLDAIARELWDEHRPELVGLTVPFPGNVYGALRIARAIKQHAPATRVALGGGYVNTELRELADPRVFGYVDFITLDDGERPLLALLDHLADPAKPLFRTFVRDGGRVELVTAPLHDIPFREVGTPTYRGLPLDRYVSLFEMLNPMHRLWADGRWNKLTVAHGCYWKKCTFCDVTLDYIARYDPVAADVLVDRIEALVAETGQTGFHFVDEAAPPAGLRALAERLIARGVTITWWGNIRFEKTFTPELAELLARSGCIAVSGGLEVASDRLLALIKKGVTVEQVARVTRAFADSNVLVHAYLMYGFPSETVQETVDSLERVRQLFEAGCVQSAFWHRFAATEHSPIGKEPELYGIRLQRTTSTFAKNDLAFDDLAPHRGDLDLLGEGLRKALYNYMHGVGFDADVRSWFPRKAKVPPTTVAVDLVRSAINSSGSSSSGTGATARRSKKLPTSRRAR
ncbi:MAG TPA: radical SAM protein [Kofleriaceae bacterium]